MKINEIVVEVLFDSGEQLQVKLPAGSTVEHLLKLLELNPEETVVVKDGVPVVEDEELEEGARLEIVRVVSGG